MATRRRKVNIPLPAPQFKPRLPFSSARPSGDELDLHGLTVEEAIPLVERFLAEQYKALRRRVWIVHGKGTGVLKVEVARFLKGHRLVRSFGPAESHHGGDGATQVDLA